MSIMNTIHSSVIAKKVALITGSSSGIGANIAKDLSKAGYKVIVTGRDITNLNRVVSQCLDAVPYVADLYDIEQVNGLISFIKVKFNRLDVLVNNACYRGNVKSILDDGAYQDLEKVMQLNLHIPLYLVHKALIPLRSNITTNAILINISSIASQVVVPLHLYSLSKSCLSEMSRQIANSCKFDGISSISIAPGPVFTNERPHHLKMAPLVLLQRVGTTQEISNLVIFAIENIAIFNGQELIIDGGYSAKTPVTNEIIYNTS